MLKYLVSSLLKRTFDKFEANCNMNKYAVKCEWMAVSDYTEELTLYDLPEANNYSATLNEKFSDTRHTSQFDTRFEVKIPTTTLKDYIEKHQLSKVDLMKVDVKMHEPEALRGMGEYLKQYTQTLF